MKCNSYIYELLLLAYFYFELVNDFFIISIFFKEYTLFIQVLYCLNGIKIIIINNIYKLINLLLVLIYLSAFYFHNKASFYYQCLYFARKIQFHYYKNLNFLRLLLVL